ncbi:MAG: EboA family metabolite traffic protein [Scytonema sp. PMC 1069.18]|nr:EboA family metabolite traffic protein [Scytonema sp. PMC 1069.18]MEC4883758.1 EboA family metabolite traffic protein [Scytonema sp. PMC 1070.18]
MIYANYLEKTDNGVTDLLYTWLKQRIAEPSLNWLDEKRRQIGSGFNTPVFFTAFSAVPRYIGKSDLNLTLEDIKAASEIRQGWFPYHWSVDQAARSLLVLSLPQENAEQYEQALDRVFAAADVGELVALYQALPLLPYPERFRARASEGIRSNMTAVFNAVALRNPYPAEYLDDNAWNQVILKALFVDSPLYLIQELDERANPELAKMLIDYARERWAANRSVSPELWRLVGRFANTAMIADLERAIQDPDPIAQKAAAIACAESPLPETRALLAHYPNLQSQIQAGHLNWKSLIESS